MRWYGAVAVLASLSVTGLSAQRPSPVARHDSAAAAFHRGLMSLRSAGVERFAAAHPAADGSGVLIAILDSGIDPGVAGLSTTTHASPKIIDLRDFSGEGRVPLSRIERRGDTLTVGGRKLLGASRVAALGGNAPIYGGVLVETRLGEAPAADINGNGAVGDTLPVVVTRTVDGWVLFADTRSAGTFAGENPVRDFLRTREYFGWHAPGAAAPVDIAVNLADSAGAPVLDLYFDTSSHGTHVAGIAAGHDLYDVPGFDGVAPGASLIGLKIANDAQAGVSVTGSMLRALDYAIRFASERGMPLVVNLSFGVGNEIEGTPRIDMIVDSILAAHPDVVMTVAAGNDGPGLSTVGFPGSASRVISVGATLPLAFYGAEPGDTTAEPIASFSSRGGEVAAPDVVTPGAAYSSVPSYAVGNELETGTSMAAPYAAGLAARLVSALNAAKRTVPAYMIRQALRVGGRSLPSGTTIDQGSGLPDLNSAWAWLSAQHEVPELAVDIGGVRGRGGILVAPGGMSAVQVAVRRLDTQGAVTLRVRADSSWVEVPPTITLADGRAEFAVRVNTSGRPFAAATIRIEGPDETAGPLALIPVGVRGITPPAGTRVPLSVTAARGGVTRFFIPADSGRGLQIEVATLRVSDKVTAALHEPGGMPFRDGATATAGFGDAAGVFEIGGNDVVTGIYELDVIGPPVGSIAATVAVHPAPLRLAASLAHDTLRIAARNIVANPLTVRLRAGLIGASRDLEIRQRGDARVRVAIAVPAWATNVAVDTRMPQAQWSRFTDFGVSFHDRTGAQFGATPINYSFSRATPDLPEKLRGDSLVLMLSPAFADPGDRAEWTLALTVKFYVSTPYSLDGGGSPFKNVAAGAIREERFRTGELPIPIPRDFSPVITAVALEGADRIWTREIVLAPERRP